jgi:hypothetical protein
MAEPARYGQQVCHSACNFDPVLPHEAMLPERDWLGVG